MTKKQLETYQSNQRLIKRCQAKIREEQERELQSVKGKVVGSDRNYPYIERRFTVEMSEPTELAKSNLRIQNLERKMEQAQREMEQVERFIDGIEDVQTREIFIYRYIDGLKIIEIAKYINYTHGRISQIINDFLKINTINKKAVI